MVARNSKLRPDVASKSAFDLLSNDVQSSDDDMTTTLSPAAASTLPPSSAKKSKSKKKKTHEPAASASVDGASPVASTSSSAGSNGLSLRIGAQPSAASSSNATSTQSNAKGKRTNVAAAALAAGKTIANDAVSLASTGAPASSSASAFLPLSSSLAAAGVGRGSSSSASRQRLEASEQPPLESADVSSSDAETPGYEDEDDDDEEEDDEEVEGAAQGGLISSTPLLISPISPLSLATTTTATDHAVSSPSSTSLASSSTLPAVPSSPSSPLAASASSSSPIAGAVYNAGADHDPSKKLAAIITRTVYGALMVTGLIALILLGQIYIIVLVFACQAIVFSELTGLFDAGYSNGSTAAVVVDEKVVFVGTEKERIREERRKGRRAKRDRWSRMISWYFFAATNYFLYGESLIYYFKHILTFHFHPSTFSFAQHHRLISFGLYVIGFVGFVADLKRAQLRRQFGLFGWIHISLLLVVVSSHFIVNNILEGLIWFWVPASLVIMNDIAAYACGMAFGRHQLIKLSPKKTVEGFVGAFFVTIVFAYFWGTFFMRYEYMTCPVQDLATNVLSAMNCVPNNAFVWREFLLPASVVSLLQKMPYLANSNLSSIPYAPFQLHSIVLAVFASLVAPFGGFFASGFKRAFNIKDFGASIPGHGGLTDRMDCQFLMGLFTYVYYASLIRTSSISVSSVLSTITNALTVEQQMELLRDLSLRLTGKVVA